MAEPSYITIDLKKHRLRIYKTTIYQMGSPQFIELLINPKEMLLAIRGVKHKTKECHIVTFSRLRPDCSFELYSKDLTKEMQNLIPQLDVACSYRFTGEVFADECVALFSFGTLQKLEVTSQDASNP